MNDAIGWTILAPVTAIVRSTFDPVKLATMVAEAIAYSLIMAFMVGPMVVRWSASTMKKNAGDRRLNDFVTTFFLPIFFTYTGLRTDAGSMSGGKLWLFRGFVLLAAIIGKFGGCNLAARPNGLPLREASIIGVMMNARGLTELIVINIGYELGILPKTVFFMLVLVAAATTYMTTPVLRRLFRSSEVWESYKVSDFAARWKRV